MPRILITGFCALPGPNRSGVQMRYIAQALARHHTVDVLVVRHAEQAYVERQGNGRILRVPISEDNQRRQVDAFRRALRRQLDGADYDIVHFRDGWTGGLVLSLRDQLEYATVFDAARAPVAEAPMTALELSAELSHYEEACLTQSDLVLVANDAARQYVVGVGARAERVYTVPPGVDVDRFDWDDPPSTNPPVILYSGSIEAGRGVRVLLRSMVYVNQQVEAKLVLAGHITPEFRSSLEHAVTELGLTGRVEFAGEVEHSDIPALIASASICVAPSACEARAQPMALFPTKLLEYMACRRPVVAPLHSTAANLVQDGIHGLLFSPGDPVDLSVKILELIRNELVSERVAEAGYQLVRRDHTAANTRRGLRKAYSYLVKLAPWGKKISDIIDEVSPDGEMMMSEDLADGISDNTDEYDTPFSERSLTASSDVTTVDPRMRDPMESTVWLSPSVELATQDEMVPHDHLVDEWVVAEQASDGTGLTRPWRGSAEVDDDGTPLDVAAVPPAESPLENRFVAGEVEVAEPNSDTAPELDNEASFTAVSVLLGNVNDDTDGAGPDEPG